MAEDKVISESKALRTFYFSPGENLGSLFEVGPTRVGHNRCGERAQGTVRIPVGARLGFSPVWPPDDARSFHTFGPDDLEVLHLGVLPGVVSGAHVALFEHLKGLRSISLYATIITRDAIERLASFPILAELTLGTPVDAGHLQLLRRLPALRALSVVAPLTRTTVAILGSLTHLETLQIRATKVTPTGAANLHRLTKLSELGLSDDVDSERMLRHLAELTWLESLWFGRSLIHDVHLERLENLTKLRNLDLSRTHIEGHGLISLRGMAELRDLSLRFTPLTDVALPHLLELRNLEYLRVDDTFLSPDAAKVLHDRLPSAKIVYSRAWGASEEDIARTERELGIRLPPVLREHVHHNNGGRVYFTRNPHNLSCDLFHIPEADWRGIEGIDMVSATHAARSLPFFPADGVCIAKDSRGARILARRGSHQFERWQPRTGQSRMEHIMLW